MPKEAPKDEAQKDEPNPDEQDPEWEKFMDFVGKMAQVQKEELDEKRAEYERKKKRKRAG